MKDLPGSTGIRFAALLVVLLVVAFAVAPGSNAWPHSAWSAGYETVEVAETEMFQPTLDSVSGVGVEPLATPCLDQGAGDDAVHDLPSGCVEDLGTLSGELGGHGSWSSGCDSTNRAGSYARFYSFSVIHRTEVQIDLTSENDAFLSLLVGSGTGGHVITSNDNMEVGNTDARIRISLPAGTYTVEATTNGAQETGEFTLEIQAISYRLDGFGSHFPETVRAYRFDDEYLENVRDPLPCIRTHRGEYWVFVPTAYTSDPAAAKKINGRLYGTRIRGERIKAYKTVLLEIAIRPASQPDVFVDFPEFRDFANTAAMIGTVADAYIEVDKTLLETHLHHLLHHSDLLPIAAFGTLLFDAAVSAAANRAIEVDKARQTLAALEEIIPAAMPEDEAWPIAFQQARADLDRMTSPDGLTRWRHEVENNLDEMAAAVAKLIIAKVATKLVVGALHLVAAKFVIATAPISLTVGLIVTAAAYFINQRDEFWDELTLAGIAAQLYALSRASNAVDDKTLNYVKFLFYQHLHKAAEVDFPGVDSNQNQPKNHRTQILSRRDAALFRIISSPTWKLTDDFYDLQQARAVAPRGIWSDGQTLWVSYSDDRRVYSYNLQSKLRTEGDDLVGNSAFHSTDIWSDEETMWAIGIFIDRIYAYKMATGKRDEDREIDLCPGLSGAFSCSVTPQGIWSDTKTMWMSGAGRIYAYNLTTKERDRAKEFNGLSIAGNDSPTGIWSDGTTMWVADHSDNRVYAYDMVTYNQEPSREFALLNIPDVLSNTSPRSIWSDEQTLWVADGDADRIFAYQLSQRSASIEFAPFQRKPPADFGRLNINENDHAEGIWTDGTTMWVADHHDDKIYGYDTTTKALVRTISVLKDAGNEHATGIWSDGTTLWVADHHDDKLYGYSLERPEDRTLWQTIDLREAGNEYATGMWSDETTMWVADRDEDKIYGYNLERPEDRTLWRSIDIRTRFTTPQGHFVYRDMHAEGIWSDGTTMWVADHDSDWIYAFSLSDGSRFGDMEFRHLRDSGNGHATGIWSDGTTMWVADHDDDWVYAYQMPPGTEGDLPSVEVSRVAGSEDIKVRPGSPVSLTATFSRPVSDFTADDITVVNGAAGSFAGSGAVYTFDVTPNAIGEVTVDIAADAAADADGEGNAAAPQFSLGIPYDDDGDGGISRAESILAITDYFAGRITRAQAIALIGLYFAGPPSTTDPEPGTDASDRAALVALYNATDGANWGTNTGWLTDAPLNDWYGIDTDSSGSVEAIVLQSNQLGGEVPVVLGDLASLTRLDLSLNQLTGEIPAELANLANLQDLRLHNNNLEGQIPSWLASLTGLQHLYLAGNGFTGCVPEGLADVPDNDLGSLGIEDCGGRDADFVSVSAGGFHTCGVRRDGSVACWGRNEFGQATPPAGEFASVSAGWSHTCGVKQDGTVACWGYDKYGQATPPSGEFASVSAGGWWNHRSTHAHTCGVRRDGTVACWGSNTYGKATPPAEEFASVSAGWFHTCGVRRDGTVACWGRNSYGQATPLAGEFTSVSAGFGHTCGLRQDGSVACWGTNKDGRATPPAGEFTSVSAWDGHNCGVKRDGFVACWGWNSAGQATPPAGEFASVSAGYAHTCGVKQDGTVACWGSNGYGQVTPPAQVTDSTPANLAPTISRRTPPAPVSVTTGSRQSFSATATDADSNINGWEWFLDDVSQGGQSLMLTGSSTQSFSHTFGSAGSFAVKVTFTDAAGESASDTWSVEVTDPANLAPTISRRTPPTPVSVTTGSRQSFSATATDADSNINGWEWFLDDVSQGGQSLMLTGSSTQSFSHTFGSAGSFAVKVTFTDAAGESASDTWSVEVTDPANLAPTISRRTPPTPVSVTTGSRQSFSATATDADSNINGWEWFLDGVSQGGQSLMLTGSSTQSFSHTFGSAGSFAVKVTFTDAAGESASDTWSVQVTDPALSGNPDLIVYSPSVYDKAFEPGESFSMSFWVKNQGDGPSSGTASLTYYRSSDSTISSSDTRLTIVSGTTGVGSIAASGQSLVTVTLTAQTSGVYYFGACVGTVTNESNTRNNCAAVFKVTLAIPDLVIINDSVSSSSVEAGDDFTFRATVHNQGTGESPSTTLRYYRSSDSTITISDIQVETDGVSSLEPDDTDPESERITVPSTTGTYYYGVCVDTVAQESDTTNNCSSGIRVTVTEAGVDAPDLTVDTPVISAFDGLTGDSVRIDMRVRNEGEEQAEATTLRLYRSLDSTITTSDRQLETFNVAALNAGSSRNYSILNLNVHNWVATLYYGTCVDSVTDESSTTNNCSSALSVTTVSRT